MTISNATMAITGHYFMQSALIYDLVKEHYKVSYHQEECLDSNKRVNRNSNNLINFVNFYNVFSSLLICKVLSRSLKILLGILVRSWWDLGKILLGSCKIHSEDLTKIGQDLTKILLRSVRILLKILHRSCQKMEYLMSNNLTRSYLM